MIFDNWHKFLVSDIFENLQNKKYSKIPSKIGPTPFISSTAQNNGVTKFCAVKPNQKYAITVSTNGDCFDAFWHPYEFAVSIDVEVLNCKNHILTDNEALFICSVLKMNKRKYWYDFKPKDGKVWNTPILLPALLDNGNYAPDWEYMDKFINKIFSKYKEKYKTKIQHSKTDLKFGVWKEFKFGEIVEIKSTSSGIDKIALGEDGPKIYPYITRSESKPNGIDAYVSQQLEPLDKGNQITLGLDTQTIFYQNDDFYTGQNIQIITYDAINKYNAFFLIGVLRQFLKEKFGWGGNGATLKRLRNMYISLPAKMVDGEYKPDWEFMENYIKSLPYSDKI